jgi:hypothetical protein
MPVTKFSILNQISMQQALTTSGIQTYDPRAHRASKVQLLPLQIDRHELYKLHQESLEELGEHRASLHRPMEANLHPITIELEQT